MPRVARVDVGGNIYHCLNRAVGRLRIFNSPKDYALFESLLEESVQLFDMRVLSYALMPNHWHLLLHPKENGDLGRFMHWLTNAHTRKVHTQTGTIGTGPLYQGRYKSFIVQDDKHLLTVLKYIERNPARAKLCKRVEDWQWGSAYHRTNPKSIVSASPVPLPTPYSVWVNTPEQSEQLDVLRTAVQKGRPFGAASWVEQMVKQHGLSSTMRTVGRPKH